MPPQNNTNFPHLLFTKTTTKFFFGILSKVLAPPSYDNNKIRLFLFLLYFYFFSLFLSLCLSISSGTPLLHVNHIQKDGRSARQQWKRKERRETEERVRNKTTKLADVESRKVASFGRAGNDRKTSKNGRTEDEIVLKWTDRTRQEKPNGRTAHENSSKWMNRTRQHRQNGRITHENSSTWTNRIRRQRQNG